MMLEPVFAGVPLSVDAEPGSIPARYASDSGGRLGKNRNVIINKRDAAVMHFSSNARNRLFVIAVIDKGPIAYVLIIFGPTDATTVGSTSTRSSHNRSSPIPRPVFAVASAAVHDRQPLRLT